MRLLLDVGNTRLKWRLAPSTGGAAFQTPSPALVHDGDPAALIVDADWLALPAVPQEVWIASVMGDALAAAMTEAVQRRFGLTARFVRSPASCGGWTNAYAEPQRLGSDRFLAMLALWRRGQGGFCMASAGTALTFDAVDDRGRHLGGVIAPGLAATLGATLGATRFHTGSLSGWPVAAVGETLLGRDTEACVQLGALHAAAGLLERLRRGLPRPVEIAVVTGGDADTLVTQLDGWRLGQDLVLEGLARYAEVSTQAQAGG